MAKKENNRRKFPDGTAPRPDLSEVKRSEANERQKEYDKLSVEQKFAKLDDKFGRGQGAARQRARLSALLEKKNTTNVQVEISKMNESKQDGSEKKHLKAKERRRKEKKS